MEEDYAIGSELQSERSSAIALYHYRADAVRLKTARDFSFSAHDFVSHAAIDARDIYKARKGDIIRLEESYRNDEYTAKIKIFYNDLKVKKFLSKKNISFSQPENVSAVFFPVFFINDEIQNFNENFFYKHWTKVEINI